MEAFTATLAFDSGKQMTSYSDSGRRVTQPAVASTFQACVSIVARVATVVVLSLTISGFVLPAVAQEKPANPLGELFKKIDRGIRGETEPAEESKFNRDQIDLRLPQRPEDQRRLRQAAELIRGERWHEAIEVLQHLLEQPTDAFFFDQNGNISSLGDIIRERIRTLPEAGLRNYENRFAAVAQALLDEAEESQDEELLLQVVARYSHTPAGREAFRRLAKLWEDRGELASAVRVWQRLAEEEQRPEARRQAARRAALARARMGQVEAARRLAADMDVADAAFLRRLDELEPVTAVLLETMPPFLPSPVRATRDEESDPLLIPKWSVPAAERFSVQEQVITLLRDLEDQQRAIVPALQVLGVGEYVAYRTLRSLQVRRAATGELLWEQRVEQNPETLLTPQRGEETGDDIAPYSGTMFEHHPLASLLLRDGVYGTLSSDGKHLFAVETPQPLSSQGFGFSWQRMNRDAETEQDTRSTNELVAYDLATGRVRWRMGGPRIEQRFSRTLAGTWFSGPPVSDGDDLFAVGEQNGEIMLFCLSARTGEVNWSQHLCTPGRPIDEDPVRRFWTCLPVIDQGLVICPTTSGWLIAVERRTRQLSWAYRFAPRIERQGRFRGGFAVQTYHEINRRWPVTRPVAVGPRLLVMPPELPDEFGFSEPVLTCLDLASGRELWKQPKGDSLYLAGIADGQAVLVGKSSVQARQIATDGSVSWQIPLSQTEQLPSGRGALSARKLYLPMGLRTLLTIDLELREIVNRATLPTDAVHLGNLLQHEGVLISISPLDVTAFPARHEEPPPATGPIPDLAMQIRRVDLLAANHEYLQAYGLLEEILSTTELDSLSEGQREQLREQEWQCLLAMIRARIKGSKANPSATGQTPDPDRWMERLRTLATTRDRQLTYRRLLAETQQSSGEWLAALREYRSLLADSPPGLMVADGTRDVRIDGWVAGRLKRMQASLSPEERLELDNELELWVNASSDDGIAVDVLARVLAFHRLGQELERTLASQAEQAGRLGEALLRFQRVSLGPDPPLAELATEQLTRIERNLNSEVGQDLVNSGPQEGWGKAWQALPGGGGHHRDSLSTIVPVGETIPALRNVRLLHDQQHQRLRIEEVPSGRMIWSVPLRSTRAMEHNPSVGVRWVGPLALTLHRGMLHALRFPDREIAWTYTPVVEGLSASRLRTPARQTRYGMQSIGSYANSNRLSSVRNTTGYLLTANPRAVLVLTRELAALDPLTGEVLWRDAGGSQRNSAHALGSDFLIATARTLQRIDHLDGAAESSIWMERHGSDAIAVVDRDLILLTESKGDRQLRRESSETGEIRWTRSVDRQALAGQPDADSFLWLDSSGQLHHVDLHSGHQTLLGSVPEPLFKAKRQVSIISDTERFYLVIDVGNAQASYVNMPSIRTSGAVLGFDRHGGNFWCQEIDALWRDPEFSPVAPGAETNPDPNAPAEIEKRWSLNLLLDEFEENPLLVLIGDRPEQREEVYFRRLRLVGLDKRTGEPLIRWGRPSDSNGFKYLHVDLAERFVELRTYTSRLQLRPVETVER